MEHQPRTVPALSSAFNPVTPRFRRYFEANLLMADPFSFRLNLVGQRRFLRLVHR
jgi:hypothetical protein